MVKCSKCEHQFLFQPAESKIEPSEQNDQSATDSHRYPPVPGTIPSSASERVSELVTVHSTPSVVGIIGAALVLAAYWTSVIAVGSFVVFHLIWNFPMLTGARGSQVVMIPVFILILAVAGGILVVILKPIRASRTRDVARLIKTTSEPKLMQLINQVADCVGTARPSRVDVDYEFRAYAEPLESFTNLSGQDLYLRIGLPVLASCTTDHFTSLLATKLGLYSPSRNNRQIIFVRNTIEWLNRAAFQQDSWDGISRRMLTSEKFPMVNRPAACLLQLCFFLFVRIPFRIYYLFAKSLCGSDLKKQELNADSTSIAIHGPEAFRSFLIEHQNLKVAQRSAFNDFVDSIEAKYAVNDVFDVMSLKRKYLNEFQLEDVLAEVENGKTYSYDSLNCDRDRILAASDVAQDSDAIDWFADPSPVKMLLNSYPVLATQCTQDLRSYLQKKLTGNSRSRTSRSRRKNAAELERYIQAAVREGFKSAERE